MDMNIHTAQFKGGNESADLLNSTVAFVLRIKLTDWQLILLLKLILEEGLGINDARCSYPPPNPTT